MIFSFEPPNTGLILDSDAEVPFKPVLEHHELEPNVLIESRTEHQKIQALTQVPKLSKLSQKRLQIFGIHNCTEAQLFLTAAAKRYSEQKGERS